MGILKLFYERFFNLFEQVGNITLFTADTFKWLFKKPFRRHLVVEQMEKIGIQTLPVALLTSAFTGMIFIVQLYFSLKEFDLEPLCPRSLGLTLVRELAPILSGLVMAGRVGAAITAEIGTMKVTNQLDAITIMGINPVQYLSVPRLIATSLAMFGIVVMANFVGILGGYFVGTTLLDLNKATFIAETLKYIELKDFFASAGKGIFFGMIISMIGCWRGFYVKGGSKGVGKATMESVVISMILILAADYVLNLIIW